MSAEKGSAIAVEVSDEAEQMGMEMATTDRRVGGTNYFKRVVEDMVNVIVDSWWYVESYMEWWEIRWTKINL